MSESTFEGDRQFDPHNKRRVYLPLENVETCALCCKKGERLKICGSCGERVYCSAECQKKDWPVHKTKCGQSDRIELDAFHALIAALMEVQRMHPERPLHPALAHKIINPPEVGSEGPCQFPDGSVARLILLGEKMTFGRVVGKPEEWWPTAITDQVRRKLFRRFHSEHFLLPSIVATLVALVAEMYTTTYVDLVDTPDSKLRRRVRLKYHNSPIADFGIAKGRIRVPTGETFVYFNREDGTFTKGQDPNDHYWIYFTTASGKDLILDCGMYNFSFSMVVSPTAHVKYGFPPLRVAPAYFSERLHKHTTIALHYEKERFSVLRNAKIGEAIQHSHRFFRGQDARAIWEFMEKVAGRPCSDAEKGLAMKWCIDACKVIWINLAEREYLNYPEHPETVVEDGLGEGYEIPPGQEQDLFKSLKKWHRMQRTGKFTDEQLQDVFRAWKKDVPEGKLRN